MSGVKMWAWESTTGGSIISTLMTRTMPPALSLGARVHGRHWILVSIEHPAVLLREVEARRREDVDELVAIRARCSRSMDGRRRDDGDRWRRAVLVIVVAPVLLVGHPGPADVVRERALDRQRALLEIVMMMRRELGGIARRRL